MVVWLAVGFFPYWVVALDPSIASPFQIISDLDGYSKNRKHPGQANNRPDPSEEVSGQTRLLSSPYLFCSPMAKPAIWPGRLSHLTPARNTAPKRLQSPSNAYLNQQGTNPTLDNIILGIDRWSESGQYLSLDHSSRYAKMACGAY